jgi:hypothetical protein
MNQLSNFGIKLAVSLGVLFSEDQTVCPDPEIEVGQRDGKVSKIDSTWCREPMRGEGPNESLRTIEI